MKIGDPTFGVAPGKGEIYATLRTENDTGKEKLEAIARSLSTSIAEQYGLGVAFAVCDGFCRLYQ